MCTCARSIRSRFFPPSWLPLAACLGVVQSVQARIDKVYHPYVEQGVTEAELRSVYQSDNDAARDDRMLTRLGIGHAFTPRLFLEAYLIGEDIPGSGFELEAYEAEAKLQLTEQGEYWADWGMLFELEQERATDDWEAASTLLIEKETGRWSNTVNLGLEYDSVAEELESFLAAQFRYRQSPLFEPALEFYAAEDTLGTGPVIAGSQRFGLRKINWEFGVIAGLDNKTPDRTLRLLVEYEF